MFYTLAVYAFQCNTLYLSEQSYCSVQMIHPLIELIDLYFRMGKVENWEKSWGGREGYRRDGGSEYWGLGDGGGDYTLEGNIIYWDIISLYRGEC